MQTLILTPDVVNSWRLPAFQRPLRVNEKVRAVAKEILENEAIEGVLTLGRLKNGSVLYTVDGQHRIEAFKLSGSSMALADVRICDFDSMAEMAAEFVRLNSSLVRMRPDDILRGLETTSPVLKAIREACPFVGYDFVRRGGQSGPVLSMSALLRNWASSQGDTPSNGRGSSVLEATEMSKQSLESLISFLHIAHAAWGRDPEYYRLWSSLNLMICMWLWNRLVIDKERIGARRYVVLSKDDFKQCLMSASADSNYLQWLLGRNVTDRDRSPCYIRLKSIFVHRMASERSGKIMLPQPPWAPAA